MEQRIQVLEAALVNAAGSRRLKPDPPKVSQFREIRGFMKAYRRYLNGFTATEQEKKESERDRAWTAATTNRRSFSPQI